MILGGRRDLACGKTAANIKNTSIPKNLLKNCTCSGCIQFTPRKVAANVKRITRGGYMKKASILALGISAMALSGAAMADLELAKKSGCLACHSVEKKIVGPAWKDVAAKYKGDASAKDKLVNKVKKGGKGVWGPAPMPPYSPRVSDENIGKLVDFVLSL
jgi:cytochrome c